MYTNIDIIFLSDTHLGFDFPLRPRINRKRRGEDFFKNFETVLSYANNIDSDLVIHGGDLFFRSKVPEPIVDRVYQTLTSFGNSGIPIFIVPGNHERSCLPTSLFLHHPAIHVFNHPKIFSIMIQGAKVSIGGFPFIRGNIDKEFRLILDQSGWLEQKSQIKILALHQAIEGSTVGPANFTFRKGNDVISLATLPNDAMVVLCGHIHRQQIIKKTNGDSTQSIPVIFSGSTERTSVAEIDETKGFYHLIFSLNEIDEWFLEEFRFIDLPSNLNFT